MTENQKIGNKNPAGFTSSGCAWFGLALSLASQFVCGMGVTTPRFVCACKVVSRHVLVAYSGARGVEGNSAEVCEQVLNSKQDKLVCFQSVIQLAVKYHRFVF